MRHYVVCDSYVASQPTREAAEQMAARLDSGEIGVDCTCPHVVVEAQDASAARDSYWRAKTKAASVT